ncbi:MAG: RNA polymerase sigma factor [Candidatus Obscuribacterales bacterium]|nr:RNA polymerase sigma factor [Candidatus Obscuribacterales bacterium]
MAPAETDDSELIARTLAGDAGSYAVLVKKYQKLVYNVAMQIVRQKEVAADITQDSFIKAYKALSSFRSGSPFRPWLLRITSNGALNAIRDAKNTFSLDQVLDESPWDEPASNEILEDDIDLKLTEEKLESVLQTLQPLQRHIFLLRFKHDLSYEEIGHVVELPHTTIKSLLFRVRTKVRILMTDWIVDGEVSSSRTQGKGERHE